MNGKSQNWHRIHFLISFEFSDMIHPVDIHIYCISVVQMTFFLKYVIKTKEPDCFRSLGFSHVHMCVIIVHMGLMMYLTNCYHDDIQPHATVSFLIIRFLHVLPNLIVAEKIHIRRMHLQLYTITPNHTTLHITSNVNTTCIVALSWMNIVQELIPHFIQLLYSQQTPTIGFIINPGSLHSKNGLISLVIENFHLPPSFASKNNETHTLNIV